MAMGERADESEVIADSEGEEYLPMPPKLVHQPVAVVPATIESISSFSAHATVASTKDAISSSSSAPPRERPRPRPIFKGASGNSSIIKDSPGIDSFSDQIPSSLSDRVKMRKRVAPRPATSGPESISSASSRKAAVTVSSDVIEIPDSDDDDELNISHPSPNPRSKFTSKVSPLATSSSSSSAFLPMPSPQHPVPRRLNSSIPFELVPSQLQLPPSDPFPPSTGTSRYQPGDSDDFVPPIDERRKPRPIPKKAKPPSSNYNDDQLLEDEGLVRRCPSSSSCDLDVVLPNPVTADTPSMRPPKRSRKKQGGDTGGNLPKSRVPRRRRKTQEGKPAEFINDDDDEVDLLADGQPPLSLNPAMDSTRLSPLSILGLQSKKKRKRLVDDDDDAAYGDIEEETKLRHHGTNVEKKKKAPAKKAKVKTVMSDDEQQGKATKKKQAKKRVVSDSKQRKTKDPRQAMFDRPSS
ncbi:hypothetical protein B0H10DRAFT_2008032 [Mycena sp. CBHHK59/15]|nr:hypothetical protein B0H10DRAFT_2008032 [Mycena sp. CBHHK59/15]